MITPEGRARLRASGQRRFLTWNPMNAPGAREKVSAAKTKHGHSRSRLHERTATPTYWSWRAMLQRCYNPKNVHYPNYGARGITVCDRWRVFENFLADMKERPEGRTIDRIDVNGNYSKENCCWATPKEQRANQRAA